MASPIDIKRKVRDMLAANLTDFTVTWGFTTRNPPRKWCYLGDLAWPNADWVTNRSRQYTMTIPIILNALMARKTPEDAEAYIHAQHAVMEGIFSADSSLRSLGVVTWGLNPRQIGSQPGSDGGIEAQGAFELSVTYRP